MRTIVVLIVRLALSLGAADLVLTGATVYPSPEAAPIRDAVVVVRAGRIAYGRSGDSRVKTGGRGEPGKSPVLHFPAGSS